MLFYYRFVVPFSFDKTGIGTQMHTGFDVEGGLTQLYSAFVLAGWVAATISYQAKPSILANVVAYGSY